MNFWSRLLASPKRNASPLQGESASLIAESTPTYARAARRRAEPVRRLRQLLLGLLLLCGACRAGGPAVVLHNPDGTLTHVRVEVVSTPAMRANGLMYRRELDSDAGMLFIFPEEETQQFWMKNTLIPLDMIFIDAAKTVVGVVAEARPQTTTARGVGKPSKYVLEVNGGFAAKHGVAAGTTMELVHIRDEAR